MKKKNNKNFWLLVVLIICLVAFAFIVGSLIWVSIDVSDEDVDKCTKICNLKGFEFYDVPIQHDRCKCLDKSGDIIWVER